MNDLWNLKRRFNGTALIIASASGFEDIVELLLNHEGIKVNIQNIEN